MHKIPPHWKDRFATPEQLRGAAKAAMKSALTRRRSRVSNTPSDAVIKLEKLYYQTITMGLIDWSSLKYTSTLLKLARDENFSAKDIAGEMNRIFRTNKFTPNIIIARLFFLRGLERGIRRIRKDSGAKPLRTLNAKATVPPQSAT